MNNNNPIILQPNSNLGMLSAEFDDEYLFECFQKNDSYMTLYDTASPKLLLVGRTGSGKSAIIRYIENNNDHAKEIDLQEISLDYIANSDVVRFLQSLDINLDLIFQALWKHVICIELIRMVFDIKNDEQSSNVFMRWRQSTNGDSRKQRALKYLKEWESKFWVDMDENIRILTNQFEERITAEAKAEIEKFSANAGYARTLKKEKKAELQARLKKVANSDQLVDLSKVVDLLKDECEKTGKKYYILFDRLDEKWADEGLKYSLISSLIETIKKFRKVQNLKVIVSLRVDLLTSTIKNHRSVGFQPDKFGDILQEIKWDSKTLKEFVDARINTLFHRHYSRSQSVSFYDIFCRKVGQVDTFDYLLSKTLMRPRELLDFINTCLQAAEGKNEVTPTIIRQSEVGYSQERLNAVANEWRDYFPEIDLVIKCLKGLRKNQSFDDFLNGSRLDNIIETIVDANEIKEGYVGGSIRESIDHYIENTSLDGKKLVAKNVIDLLYKVGIMGVKPQANVTMQWSDQELYRFDVPDFGDDFRMQVHDIFDISLDVK